LKRAFEWKLVPRDLNAEPASILPEQIQAERNRNKPAKKSIPIKKSRRDDKIIEKIHDSIHNNPEGVTGL